MKIPDLAALLEAKEGEHFEFKAAEKNYDFDDLTKYACALANGGGGFVVLGVTDKRPRQVVGTAAFDQPERTRKGLIDRLHLRIDFEIYYESEKRVLVFGIPSRPVGVPIQYKGIYWSRKGDELSTLPEPDLRVIFAESGHDFSADVCKAAVWSDLDSVSIEDFRKRWIKKSQNHSLSTLSQDQLLRDCEAIVRNGITYAALVMFGTREALGRLLGQAEIIFEYRPTEASGSAQQRKEFRQGFFSCYDQLWELISLRNDRQHVQDGLFVLDIPTFEERVVREALLNAVSHRDYQLGGSVFIRQYPRKLVVESPGGFPPDVTPENILDRQSPRNRRIADIFSKCGLVERSGQGMNLMYELSIKGAKMLPDLKGTDRYHVVLTLDGQIHDPKFLELMEKIGQETLASFSTQDFLVVNAIHQERMIPEPMRDRLPRLLKLGILERAAKGKFILSRQYYSLTRKKGDYTRKKGLDRETNKALLLKHIDDNKFEGSKMEEFYQVLPGYSRGQIQVFLRELKAEGKAYVQGMTSGARWYPKI